MIMLSLILSNKRLMFLSPLSPAEELYFGSTESGEKKTLIVLTNVTKNIVAFKVNFWKNKLCVKIWHGKLTFFFFLHFNWKIDHFDLDNVFLIFLGMLCCLLVLTMWHEIMPKFIPGFNICCTFFKEKKKENHFIIWMIYHNTEK